MIKKAKIIKRIIKLLNLYNSSKYQGEKDECMSMANNLMDKYNISIDEVKSNQLVSYNIDVKDKAPKLFERQCGGVSIWVRGIVIQTAIICGLKPNVQVTDFNIVYGSATEEDLEYFNLWCDLLISNIEKIVTDTLDKQIYLNKFGVINQDELTTALNSMAYGMSTVFLQSFSQLPRPNRNINIVQDEDDTMDEEVILSGYIEYFPKTIEQPIKEENSEQLNQPECGKDLVPTESGESNIVDNQDLIDIPKEDAPKEDAPNLWNTDEIFIQEYINHGNLVAKHIKLTN